MYVGNPCEIVFSQFNQSHFPVHIDTLTVNAPRVQLKAKTVYGAMRGLETFSQWVSVDLKGFNLLYKYPFGAFAFCADSSFFLQALILLRRLPLKISLGSHSEEFW